MGIKKMANFNADCRWLSQLLLISAPEDVSWLLELTAPRIKSGFRSRHKQLEIDRSASLVFEHHKKAVSDNGVFRPVVVINGIVRGIWKRAIRKDMVMIELSLFHPVNKKEMRGIEKAAEKYGEFLGKKILSGLGLRRQ